MEENSLPLKFNFSFWEGFIGDFILCNCQASIANIPLTSMPLNHLRPLNEPRTYVTLFLGHYYNHGYFNQRHISQANPPLTKNQEYTLLL